ncbi:MAG: hypothetical protein M9900_01460 [Flavobacteriales bacterium]|nr:hypothetical protein [Flavobacteriales bacterium]
MSSTVEHSVKVGRAFAVEFKDIERWDPASYHAIRWNWPLSEMIRIGDLLTARKDRVDRKQWSFDKLQPVTVHNDGRISKRKLVEGRSYTMDLWFARPGDLLVAKIDLKNGAIAIVPEEWENVAVTNHFVPFQIDHKRVVPEYLHRVFQMGVFRDLLWRNKVGAEGRKEVKLEFFLDQCVPLPPLATQRSIVAHWQAGMQQAAALEAKAKELVEEAQAGFERTLGINAPQESDQRKAFAIDFMAIDRWGVRATLTHALKGAQGHDDFPIERLGNVIVGLENGWSPKCYDRPANGTEWGVLKLGAVSFGRFNDAENKALPKAFVPKENLEVRAGDVLIIRGNVLRLVGAFAYVDATRPKLMLPDLIFRVKFKRERLLDPQFLVALMHCADLRQQIESAATGTSPTMKKVTVGSILNLEFPLPPIDRQRELLKPMTAALSQSTKLKDQAETKRKETKEEVEGMVMGTSKV